MVTSNCMMPEYFPFKKEKLWNFASKTLILYLFSFEIVKKYNFIEHCYLLIFLLSKYFKSKIQAVKPAKDYILIFLGFVGYLFILYY